MPTARLAVIIIACLAPFARADIRVEMTPDGAGGTNVSITGTYDIAGGTDIPDFVTEPDDNLFTYGGSDGRLTWVRRTAPSTGYAFRSFSGLDNPVDFYSAAFTVDPMASGLSADSFSLRLQSADFRGLTFIEVYGGAPLSGTLNESLSHPALPFAHLNRGVWNWGSFGGVPNDGVRLVIAPTPGAAALACTGALALTRRRRR